MMQFRQKLAYMALGGFLVFIGQLLPGLINENRATAQDEPQRTTFHEIECQSIKIVDENGNTHALLKKEANGSVIQIYNRNGDTICNIAEDSTGGRVAVQSSQSRAYASLGIDARNSDGRVTVTDVNGRMRAWLMVDQFGARIASR